MLSFLQELGQKIDDPCAMEKDITITVSTEPYNRNRFWNRNL